MHNYFEESDKQKRSIKPGLSTESRIVLAPRPERLLLLCAFDGGCGQDAGIASWHNSCRFQLTVIDVCQHDQVSENSYALRNWLHFEDFCAVIIHDSVSKNIDNLDMLDAKLLGRLRDYFGIKIFIKSRETRNCLSVQHYISKVLFDRVFDAPVYPGPNQDFELESFIRELDLLLEEMFASKGLLCKKRYVGSGNHVLLFTCNESKLDPRISWFARSKTSGIQIHQLGIVQDPKAGSYHSERADAGHLWTISGRNWNTNSIRLLDPLVSSDAAGMAAYRELLNVVSLLQMSEGEIAATLGGTSQRLSRHFRYLLNLTMSLVEFALAMRGLSAIIAVDLFCLPAALILKAVFKVPVLYDAHEYYPENEPETLEFEKLFWCHFEERLLQCTDYSRTVSARAAAKMLEKNQLEFKMLPDCTPDASGLFSKEVGGCSQELSNWEDVSKQFYADLEEFTAGKDHKEFTVFDTKALGQKASLLDPCLIETVDTESAPKAAHVSRKTTFSEDKDLTTQKYPGVTDASKHMLMIVPDANLLTNSRLLNTINRIAESSCRVSVLCPPQETGVEELESLLHKSARLFLLPVHMPEAECYDLAHLTGRRLNNPMQRLVAFLMEKALDRPGLGLTQKLPLFLGRPLKSFLNSCFEKVQQLRQNALAQGRYWQHFLKYQLPQDLYLKYENLIKLDCFTYFYVIKALIINKEVEAVDAVYCSYPWSLPAGCLIKDLIPVTLVYDSLETGISSLSDLEARDLAEENRKWMHESCNVLISSSIMEDSDESCRDDQVLAQIQQNEEPDKAGTRLAGIETVLSDTGPGSDHARLNICIFYDQSSVHIGTVYEHLSSFSKFLKHNVSYLPATNSQGVSSDTDLSVFDVIIVHYSVRLSISNHIDARLAEKLANFGGSKILFIQDEYDCTETARVWMERLKFDIVYTCVPQKYCQNIYPSQRFPDTTFKTTLTGYVPDDPEIESYIQPIHKREILIAYRGRVLPYHYGSLCFEKYLIGVEMKRLAKKRGINVDIEVDDSSRIYGADWYRFLGSARATLATESGSNVFDFEGKLKVAVARLLALNPDADFAEVEEKIIGRYDGLVKMNQVSPKIFEAIRLRTALILFEGEYSNVVRANLHFIPLKKDFSNIDEVIEKLNDIDYLTELTDRAYSDIIESGSYSYKRFAAGIDADLEALLHMKSLGAAILSANQSPPPLLSPAP